MIYWFQLNFLLTPLIPTHNSLPALIVAVKIAPLAHTFPMILLTTPSSPPVKRVLSKYSRNIVHFLKKVILRCIGLCFNYHHLYLLSRLDQPLIQRIPAGLSSTVACLDITNFLDNVLNKDNYNKDFVRRSTFKNTEPNVANNNATSVTTVTIPYIKAVRKLSHGFYNPTTSV